MTFKPLFDYYLKKVLNVGNVALTDGPPSVSCKDGKLIRDKDGNICMNLPLTNESMEKMLYPDVPKSVAWGFGLGELYHELGHVVSGEPVPLSNDGFVKARLSNLISDANENTILPRRWFGSTRYINYKWEAIGNAHDVNVGPTDEVLAKPLVAQFTEFIWACNYYRHMLHIVYDGKEVESLPDDHPFSSYFEKAKPVLERARSEYSMRPAKMKDIRWQLINEMFEIVKEWTDALDKQNEESPNPQESAGSGGSGTNADSSGDGNKREDDGDDGQAGESGKGAGKETGKQKNKGAMQKLEEQLAAESAMGESIEPHHIALSNMSEEEIKSAVQSIGETETKQLEGELSKIEAAVSIESFNDAQREQDKIMKAIQKFDKNHGLGDNLRKSISSRPHAQDALSKHEGVSRAELVEGGRSSHASGPDSKPDADDKSPEINMNIAARLQRAFKRMMFKRSLSSRYPSSQGEKFHPPNFYQIKTHRKPNIKVDETAIKYAPEITYLTCMFDSSFSMKTGGAYRVASSTLSTIYEAIRGIRGIYIKLFSFSSVVHAIKDGPNVHRNILAKLRPSGTTRFPYAERIAIRSLEKIRSKRVKNRIVIMFTDGDMGEDDSGFEEQGIGLRQLKLYAKKQGVKIITIHYGLPSSAFRQSESKEYFDEYIHLTDIKQLPGAMERITRKWV